MTPQETARAILALYAGDESRWTKRVAARSALKRPCDSTGRKAVCWCIGGAAKKVGSSPVPGEPFDLAMQRATGIPNWAGLWNDAPERTFADVVALLERIASEPAPEPPAEAP